ncbi:MGH1-like glycoside hydrolase domain-containing protein [Streptomyces avicenniae]|uniref:MGH1-like glycoside hydrolase domain-containing protein n=1 Tax=Streptomyces avicenniae TaxID=500153 RepID=UPI00069A729D|nr:trehalase family glycosidase [Streptomyces avicenniae]
MSHEDLPHAPAPVGWNTWDVRVHTGMSHLPSGLRVRFGVLAPDGPVTDGFTWRDGLVRLGPHSLDGAYAEARVRAEGHTLGLLLAGGPGDRLHARLECAGEAVVVLDGFDGAPTEVVEAGGVRWRIDVPPTARPLAVPGALAWRCAPGDTDLRIAPDGTPGGAADTPGVLADRRARADAELPHSGGWLDDSADALTRALTWNVIHVPALGRVLTPTSRDFVSTERRGFYGSWALHAWDTFFTGLAASTVDRDYARGVFTQILPHATDSGMIPNRVSDDRGRTDDRSQPPVGALTVLKAYLAGGLSDATRDRRLVRETFPALLAWHDWWHTARRGPHGLLAWGSDPIAGDPESATLDRAKRESGLDDSPMYDHAAYDPATHCMDLADAGLNALHIADADALAALADVLAAHDTAARLRAEAADARTRADALLWSAEQGGYRNLTADGTHDPHVSPTLLYPLLAGLPDPGRAAALADALLEPGVLGGDRPLPSTARDDPAFAATYWRGRIWAPMAYLAVEGLRRSGLTDHSRAVVRALLRLFLTEWHEHSHVRENYPAHSGENLTGLPARSDGLMAWGGLLALLAFGELADAREDGWRFAHPGEAAALTGLPLGEGRLSVHADDDALTVTLDGGELLRAAPGVVVTGYVRDADHVTGTAHGHGDLAVTPPDGGPPLRLTVRGAPLPFRLPRA